MRNAAKFALLLLFGLAVKSAQAQSCEEWTFSAESEIPSVCSELFLTMLHDKFGRPYLYVAAKEGGLKIFDISIPSSPALVQSIPSDALYGLHLMNLFQQDRYLYLALGNHFGSGQSPGMAVVDIADPARAVVSAVWKSEASGNGAGVVVAQGDYAYLGAMGQGVYIFDVSDKNRIKELSHYLPPVDFPKPNPTAGELAKINARGMAVAGNRLYLCYDAGGVRAIDLTDKAHPVERARYSNPAFDRLPRAYNNIVLDDHLAYVTFDYCGVEVLDLSGADAIEPVGWWNPWNCPANNWFTSLGHTNEIAFDPDCKKVFVSAGKTELYVLDVSDPTGPRTCTSYGDAANNRATWGVSVFRGQVFLSYVCNFLGIPFFANWTGITLLSYDRQCATGAPAIPDETSVEIFPNPAQDVLNLVFPHKLVPVGSETLKIYDMVGRIRLQTVVVPGTETAQIDVSSLPGGIYQVVSNGWSWGRFIKME